MDTFDTLLVNKRRIDEALAALRARRGDNYHDVVSMTCAGAMLMKLATLIAARNPDIHHTHLVETISQFVATAGALSCKLLPDTSISDLIQDAEMILTLGDLSK